MVLRDYDLAIIVRDILNLPKTTTKVALHFKIVRAFKRAMARALQNEDYITVSGFGTFKVFKTKPRMNCSRVQYGGKFREGYYHMTKSKKIVRFRPSPSLKEFIKDVQTQS